MGIPCSFQTRINGPRRIIGVAYEVLKQVVNYKKIDVVLTDSIEFVPLAWLLAKIYRKPLIVRERGDGWAEVKQKEKVGSYLLPGSEAIMDLYSLILRQCAAVIPVSDYMGSRVKINAKVNEDRVFTVPISVDVKAYQQVDHIDAHGYMQLDKKKDYLVSVTNFRFPEKVKKIEEFMPTIVSLLKRNENVELLVAGDGPYLETFKKNIASVIKPVSDRVKILGYVKNIHAVYALSKVVLYLSGLDAFPRAILEAMASSCPVVANSFGGIPEMIIDKENGFLINNQEEFLEIAQLLLDNHELRHHIGKSARVHVVNHYIPYIVGLKWVETLNKIMDLDSK